MCCVDLILIVQKIFSDSHMFIRTLLTILARVNCDGDLKNILQNNWFIVNGII